MTGVEIEESSLPEEVTLPASLASELALGTKWPALKLAAYLVLLGCHSLKEYPSSSTLARKACLGTTENVWKALVQLHECGALTLVDTQAVARADDLEQAASRKKKKKREGRKGEESA